MIVSIEQHVDWIADCVGDMRQRGCETIEAERDAEDKWVAHVNAGGLCHALSAGQFWYMGANIPGKPRIFMPYIAASAPIARYATTSRPRGTRGSGW